MKRKHPCRIPDVRDPSKGVDDLGGSCIERKTHASIKPGIVDDRR